MSKIALTPDAAGTGVFTIASPATSTNRTLTLPDQSGTVLVNGTTSNVGIGTSSPITPLHIITSGNTAATFQSTTDNSNLVFTDASTTANVAIGAVSGNNFRIQLNNSEAMRIDSSGNVGVGLTPSSWWSGMKAVETQSSSGGVFASASVNGLFLTNAYYDGSNWKYKNNAPAEYYSQTGGTHQFLNASSGTAGGAITWSESMCIDSSGNLLVNSAPATGKVNSSNIGGVAYSAVVNASGAGMQISSGGQSNTMNAITFQTNYGAIGSIVCGSATSYNTSSDYRLKTDAQPMTGASDRVLALKPINFAWISSGERVDGFLAHEAQEIVPECVTGTKDAMRDEEYEVTAAVEATYDEDGNELTAAVPAVMGTRSVPDYQGIDQSKLVPLLTAALQEALTEISALKARVTALEAN